MEQSLQAVEFCPVPVYQYVILYKAFNVRFNKHLPNNILLTSKTFLYDKSVNEDAKFDEVSLKGIDKVVNLIFSYSAVGVAEAVWSYYAQWIYQIRYYRVETYGNI